MIGGKKRMQTAVIAILAFIAGEIIGVATTAILVAGGEEDKQEENK